MRLWRTKAALKGKSVGFVPTMGALHEGHLSLIRCAKSQNDVVAVSIFVNPSQFAPGEDVAGYPRPFARDRQLCEKEGVDVLFAPGAEEIYPAPSEITLRVGRLGQQLCGRIRPGHFDAVARIVAKLFHIVEPTKAYFGKKDYQQYLIVCEMVRDLNFPVTVIGCPVVRDADGVCLSSRISYLSEEEQKQARCLYQALDCARRHIESRHSINEAVRAMRLRVAQENDARVDYAEIVDPQTLAPVRIGVKHSFVLAAIAVYIGKTRLIDNMLIKIP